MGLIETLNISETMVVKVIPEVLKKSTFYLLKTDNGFSFYATDEAAVLRKLECCPISREELLKILIEEKTEILNLVNNTTDHSTVHIEYLGTEPFLYREDNTIKASLENLQGPAVIFYKKDKEVKITREDLNESNYLIWYEYYKDGKIQMVQKVMGTRGLGIKSEIILSEDPENINPLWKISPIPPYRGRGGNTTVRLEKEYAHRAYNTSLSVKDIPGFSINLDDGENKSHPTINVTGYTLKFQGYYSPVKVIIRSLAQADNILFEGMSTYDTNTAFNQVEFNGAGIISLEVLENLGTIEVFDNNGVKQPLVYYLDGERVESPTGEVYARLGQTLVLKKEDYPHLYFQAQENSSLSFGISQSGSYEDFSHVINSEYLPGYVRKLTFNGSDITQDTGNLNSRTKIVRINSEIEDFTIYVEGSEMIPMVGSLGNNNVEIQEGQTLVVSSDTAVPENLAYQLTPVGGRITNQNRTIRLPFNELPSSGPLVEMSFIKMNTATKRVTLTVPGETFKYTLMGVNSQGLFSEERQATDSVTLDLEPSWNIYTSVGNVITSPDSMFTSLASLDSGEMKVFNMNDQEMTITYEDLTQSETEIRFGKVM